ncbi:Bd3614 family nucleic acid deaminase [Silvanigrella aquatica]|uniref:CMP/dCMP-type deaminase domain-containing protein n=1 Tax=Silvanigrella aquatica TaxID=1915309 RepID=A0A1L4D3C2_9BACT|nr:Bd3614 family nucleic acid deaminase [Silvanigrella aquatica]APJ04687.1 hypothetical protein AXG55_12555 [Silvanigrella aquatica]
MKQLQEDPIIKQIMYELIQIYKNTDIAFLIHQDTIYYSKHRYKTKTPESAITKLIQGIYDKFPEKCQTILRNKIYYNYLLTEMCLGMIKVAAKRHQFLGFGVNYCKPIPAKIQEIKYNNKFQYHFENKIKSEDLIYDEPNEHLNFIKIAENITHNITQENELYQSNRKIACILVSEESKILAVGLNENSKNKTQHAEVNLIQSFYQTFKKPLPKNTTLYTTRKPCKMCAGMIWTCTEDIKLLKVFFLHDDPGSMAKYTVLNRGTLERKRAAQSPEELIINIEEKIDNLK